MLESCSAGVGCSSFGVGWFLVLAWFLVLFLVVWGGGFGCLGFEVDSGGWWVRLGWGC